MATHWQPNATLIVRRGPSTGQQFTITEAVVTAGRRSSCDIHIDEPEVSRQHARITWSGTDYVIEDLRSANGTFVNGERISGPQALKDGDLVGLGGQVELAFQMAAPLPSDERLTMVAEVMPPSGEPVELLSRKPAPPTAHAPPPPSTPSPEPVPAKKGFPWVVVVIGVLILLCLCLVLAGGGYYWFSQS